MPKKKPNFKKKISIKMTLICHHQGIDEIEPIDKLNKLIKILANIMKKKNKIIKLINQDLGIKKIINLIFQNNNKKSHKAVEGGDEVEAQI